MPRDGPAVTPTLDRQELDDLKARVDLLALIESSGLDLKRVGKNWFCRCPFHEDREASLSINPETRLWNCFGCEAGGDCFRWCQLRENLDFAEAVEFARRFATLSVPDPAPATREVPERSALLTRVMERYVRSFKESTDAQMYLASRGLSSRELWETFRVGYVDGSLLKSLPGAGPVREQLTTLGILRANGQEHFHGCVVVPLEHPDDGLVGFYGRRLDPAAKVPHLYLPGPKRGVLQWQALKRGGCVYLAESVLDALSLWQAGQRDVSCVFGAGHLHPDLETLLGRMGPKEVVFALDGDQAGLNGVQKMSERLAKRGLHCSWTPLPDGKDPNQLLQEIGPDGLRELIARPRSFVMAEPAAPAQDGKETHEDGFTMVCDEIRYRITMIPPFVGRLRALLVASRDSQVYSEKLDLHSQRARALNASQLVRSFEISRPDAERHLSLILKTALEWVDTQKTEETSLRKKAPELNEGEKREALAFLKEPDLVQNILRDCEALGFVGEEKAKLLGYLIGLSRKLPKPLSGIVISQSGAGKSSLTELVEQLTPPEDVLLYSRLTPQALYYMNHDLKGLLLILEERAGGESADYSIRTLQSRQKLRLASPIKDPVTGKMTTQCYEVEGPVAYLETTTNPYLNPENSSRCFELFMDESEEQTRRIQKQQKRQRLFREEDLDEICERIKQKHHNAQRLLRRVKVFIPYAELIEFPSQWLRTRRDNERFLCLIEVIAFLHQYQRKQGETAAGRYVLANLEDYQLAYELAQELFASTLHELTRDARTLFEMVVEWARKQDLKSPQNVLFGFKELRPVTKYANHRLRRAMAELVEMEYVLQTQCQNGLPAQFRLLTTDLTHSGARLVGLTTPDELRDLLAQGHPFRP